MLPTIDTININKFKGISIDYKDICTLELTITTGLEEVAAQECREKLSVDPVTCRGRVLFDIIIADVPKVLKLRSVDHINVVLYMESNFQLTKDRDTCFKKIFKFSGAPDWQKGIEVWQTVFGLKLENPFQWRQSLKDEFCVPRPDIDLRLLKKDSDISGNLPENLINSMIQKNIDGQKKNTENEAGEEKYAELESEMEQNKDITNSTQRVKSGGPKFRVTCHRVGSNHKFGSPEAARQFGGGINEMFGWPVDLNNFDVEVLLSIIQDFVYVGISLTKEALFKRNISYFGPTNLRATICYNMLRLAKPEPGDIVIDPMCGGCSIPIEGTLTYNNCLHLGGDNFPSAVNRSRQNIDFLTKNNKRMCVDVAQWDVTRLPLRDQLADVIVCDLPFGKRCGSKVDNRILYFKSLVELARVTRVQTGRAVLLTHDRNSMTKNLHKVKKLWKNFSTRTINIGGLAAGIFLLQRTNLFKDDTLLSNISSNMERRSQKRKHESPVETLPPQNL